MQEKLIALIPEGKLNAMEIFHRMESTQQKAPSFLYVALSLISLLLVFLREIFISPYSILFSAFK